MKKRILLFVGIVAFCTSVTKAQMTFPNADSVINYLSGSWKWYNSCGGITGTFCQTPSNLGYSQGLIFSRITGITDSIAYKYYKNGTLTETSGAKISYTGTPGFGNNWTLYFKRWGGGPVSLHEKKGDSTLFRDLFFDGYMHNIYRDLNVGIPENMKRANLKIYPVPATDRLQIHLEDGAVVEGLRFFALSGQQVTAPLFNKNEYDISALTPGVYFLEVKTNSSTCWAKVLKE